MPGPPITGRPESLDDVAADLQRLRANAGAVSYSEIAQRIGTSRQGRGMSPAAAHVARTSVYDVFRPGRSRTNPELVAEIVLALGCTDDEAETWRQRCVNARLKPAPSRTAGPPASPVRGTPPSATLVVLLMVAGLGINLFGHGIAGSLVIPLYLDMIGTAVTAVVLGPWHAVAVGLATNLLGAINEETQAGIPFALVNIAGALVWGYGIRTWGFGRGPVRYWGLNAIAAIVCSLVAAPIIVLVFGGFADHPADVLTHGAVQLGGSLWSAVFSTNLLVSLTDKLIAGAAALGVLWLLVRHASDLLPTVPDVWLVTSSRFPRGGAPE